MSKWFVLLVVCAATVGCEEQATARSGVQRATVEVQTDPNNLTVEQKNVKDRLLLDNKPGSIKHLYVLSAYSGQTLIYSTVRGKVTSSGKRLSPTTIAETGGQYGSTYHPELLQDDGTYGSSVDYLYWWDSKGVYHQHYVSGGQILHVSDQPLVVKDVIINMEAVR